MNTKKQIITILALSIVFVVSFAPAGFCCDGFFGCIGAGASAVGGALKDGAVAVGGAVADGASAAWNGVTEGVVIDNGNDTYYEFGLHTKSDCLGICEKMFENTQSCIDSCDNMALCGTYGGDRSVDPWQVNTYPGSQCAHLSYEANSNLLKDNKNAIEFNKACTAKDEDELKNKLTTAVTQKPYSKKSHSFMVGDGINTYITYITYASWGYDKMCMTGIDEYKIKDGSKVKYMVYRYGSGSEDGKANQGYSIYDGEKDWKYNEWSPVPDDGKLEFQYDEENNGWGNKDSDGSWVSGGWGPAPDGWCAQSGRECVIKKKIEITNDITLTSPLEILKQGSVGYAWPAEIEIVGIKKDGKLPVIKLSDNFKAGDKAAITIEDGEHSFVISGIKFTNIDIDFSGVSSKLTITNSEFENTDTPLKPDRGWTVVDNLFSGSAPFIKLQGDADGNLIADNDFSSPTNMGVAVIELVDNNPSNQSQKDAEVIKLSEFVAEGFELKVKPNNDIIIGNEYPPDSSITVSSPSSITFSSVSEVLYGGKIAATPKWASTCTSYPYCYELTFTKPKDVPIAAIELYRDGKRLSLICNPYYEKDIIEAVNSAKLSGSNKGRSLGKNACDQQLSADLKGKKILVSAPYETFNTQDRADLWAQWMSKKSVELVSSGDLANPTALTVCKKKAAEGYYSKLGGDGDWIKYNDALEKCGMDAGWCDVMAQAETMCQDSTCNNEVANCPSGKQYPPGVTKPDNKLTAIFHSGEWTPLGSPIKVLAFEPFATDAEKEQIGEKLNTQTIANFNAGATATITSLNDEVTEEGCFEKAKKAQESACEGYHCGDDDDCMDKCILANACNAFAVYCVPDVNLESDVYKENCMDESGEKIHRGDGLRRYLPPDDGGEEVKCDGGTWNSHGSCECPEYSHLSAGACVCDDNYEKYGGVCTETCKDGQIRDALGQCVCPAGTIETPGGACEPPPECYTDAECKDDKICKDGKCVVNEPEPLGGECKINSDCSAGMLCSLTTEKCECDTANNFYPPFAGAKTCEYNEPAVGGICEINGGQYLQDRCIYNKSEAACIVGGGAWEGGECINKEEPSADAGGCSCNLASEAAAPAGSMGMAIAYLSMLGSILFVRVRRAKRSRSYINPSIFQ